MAQQQWTFAGGSASVGSPGSMVTLVEGSSFCLSARTGDIYPGTSQGLFFLDTRFLSGFVLRIDDLRVDEIAMVSDLPFTATFVGLLRPPPRAPEGSIAIFRRRFVDNGMVEKILLRNYDARARTATVTVQIQADLADLFAVKEQRPSPAEHHRQESSPTGFEFGVVRAGVERTTLVEFSQPAEVEPGLARWQVELPPRGEWELCISVTGAVEGTAVECRHTCGETSLESPPTERLRAWQASMPVADTDDGDLLEALEQTSDDLGALGLVDGAHPEDLVIAAGAPWFMTLFGRDSLITAHMALIADHAIATGVLRTLARLQGRSTNAETEEQPGRILHEIRFHDEPSTSFEDGTIYFGSIDATPLFVMLVGEAHRWGLPSSVLDGLTVPVDRALAWIEEHGDRDGDGYVEYQRSSPEGLLNQGWKDSWDGITFADGTIPEGPIALCEVQGYVYAAHLARALMADVAGDTATANDQRARAADLKARFNRDFWIEDAGYVALALDGEKRQVDALASNMGHCLWTGILDADKASSVAHHLMSPPMFSGWGVRTLATTMQAYNPISYHNGSVWPHDNAIVAAGLMRYGHVRDAHRVIGAMLDVSAANRGRLPELLSGLGRDELSAPAVYPTSCIPQAWAAASPLLFLRTLLRLDPQLPAGRVSIAPALPERMTRLSLAHVPLGPTRIDIAASRSRTEVTGLGQGIELSESPLGPG